MQPIFDLTTENLIRGFNFISKVCAAELNEINILPTDRIITSAMTGESDALWNRMLLATDRDPILMKDGWHRCYRFFCSEPDEISFLIFAAKSKDPKYIYTFSRPRYTKDQTIQMNVVIPNLAKLNVAPEDLDHTLYKLIKNLFRYFLRANHDATCCGVGTTMISYPSTLSKTADKYIEVLAPIFTLLTGLLSDGFKPEDMEQDIYDLFQEMSNDSGFISVCKEGYMNIHCTDDDMIYYLDRLAIAIKY